MLIDSHCHVNFSAYHDDMDKVIDRCLSNDIWLINIGSEYHTSFKTIEIANNYDQGVYAVVGLHPIHVTSDIIENVMVLGQKKEVKTPQEKFDYDKYKYLAQSSNKVVGLGEIGLDYFYFDKNDVDVHSKKQLQQEVFEQFMDLANELDLPLVIHCRGHLNDPYGAYDDILKLIKNNNKEISGVIHCFGGNMSQAKEFIDLGFYIGFTGIITFKKKAEDLQAIVAEIPLNRILIETDAPFLAPEPYRGQRNEPYYVKFVAEKVAKLKDTTIDEVAKITTSNAKKLFNI